MKVAIVGSRNYPRLGLVTQFVYDLPLDTTVISGGAKGVDQLAVTQASTRGLATKVIPAEWDRFGKQAGMLRNVEIVNECEQLVAFWDGVSSGTKHSIGLAKWKGILTLVYGPDGLLTVYNGETQEPSLFDEVQP